MSLECQVKVKSQSELDIGGRETCCYIRTMILPFCSVSFDFPGPDWLYRLKREILLTVAIITTLQSFLVKYEPVGDRFDILVC